MKFKIIQHPSYRKLFADSVDPELTLGFDVYRENSNGAWECIASELDTKQEAQEFIDFYLANYKEFIIGN